MPDIPHEPTGDHDRHHDDHGGDDVGDGSLSSAGLAARLAAVDGAAAQAAAVVAAWRADAAMTPSTAARLGDLAGRYARRLEATGRASLAAATPADVEGFVWAPTRRGQPPSPHTLHLRRTAVGGLYRTLARLGVDAGDPSRHVALPPKTRRVARPLDDAEIALVRTAALAHRRWPQTAAAVAVAEATATTSEIARLAWTDLDLTDGRVALPGAPPIAARTATLSAWAAGTLARIRGHVAPDPAALLVYRGRADADSHAAQAAVANLLRRLLVDAGVAAGDVKPSSIRLWAARRALDDGASVETVAVLLGLASLDAAADAVGYHWQPKADPR